jgi:hypothetical protein
MGESRSVDHVGSMHRLGAECCCRIPHQCHVIAEFSAAAGGGLDAGIGQHSYQDDLFDAALLELEIEVGTGKPTCLAAQSGARPRSRSEFIASFCGSSVRSLMVRHLQDWINYVLGLWVFGSPWFIEHAMAHGRTRGRNPRKCRICGLSDPR